MLLAFLSRLQKVCQICDPESIDVGIFCGYVAPSSGARVVSCLVCIAAKTFHSSAICFPMVRRRRHHTLRSTGLSHLDLHRLLSQLHEQLWQGRSLRLSFRSVLLMQSCGA